MPGWETPAAGKAMAAGSQRAVMTCDDGTGLAQESQICPAKVNAEGWGSPDWKCLRGTQIGDEPSPSGLSMTPEEAKKKSPRAG